MANPTPPVKTCVLRVGIKCCKGCQTNAKRKLLNVSGVSAVVYNAEQGLLTVSGVDVNPTTILHKLTKWGKNAELVSVLGDNSFPIPRTPEQNQSKTMETKTRPTKCCLLMCFGKRRRKAKIEPLVMPNFHYPGVGTGNGNATPFINVGSPPMVYPPPQAMPGFATPIPYPPPYFGDRQPPPPPYTGGMFQSVPPQSPPYVQLRQAEFPRMVNSGLHYRHH